MVIIFCTRPSSPRPHFDRDGQPNEQNITLIAVRRSASFDCTDGDIAAKGSPLGFDSFPGVPVRVPGRLGVPFLNLRPIAALTFFGGWCSTQNFRRPIMARFARRTELELALDLQDERG